MVVRADGAHNHAAESEHSIEKQDLQQRCKKRAREEPEEKASNIIINVLKNKNKNKNKNSLLSKYIEIHWKLLFSAH